MIINNDADGLLLHNNHEFTVNRHEKSDSVRGDGVCVFVSIRTFLVVSLPAAQEHLEVVCFGLLGPSRLASHNNNSRQRCQKPLGRRTEWLSRYFGDIFSEIIADTTHSVDSRSCRR